MELKEFTKKVLKDLIDAVEEVRAEASRDLHLVADANNRTVEFDVAVSVETESGGSAAGAIKVLNLVQIAGDSKGKNRNSTVSHIRFGVTIDELTKQEQQAINEHKTTYSPGLTAGLKNRQF